MGTRRHPSHPLAVFERQLGTENRRLFRGLTSPAKIQGFLDSIPYRSEEVYCSALGPLRDRRANCFDGALLAAAALRKIGDPPLLLQLVAERDDEHLLAIYRRRGLLGAVAKSNIVGLRYREPVYRTLRELVMSYFEAYFNVYAEKCLRGYTRPINLRTFDAVGWMWRDESGQAILDRLDQQPRVKLVEDGARRWLSKVDRRSFEAHMLGVNPAGLYVPPP